MLGSQLHVRYEALKFSGVFYEESVGDGQPGSISIL